MPQYRVKWEEIKSMVVEAENEESALEIALDFEYENATLEEQSVLDVMLGNPRDDEKVYRLEDKDA